MGSSEWCIPTARPSRPESGNYVRFWARTARLALREGKPVPSISPQALASAWALGTQRLSRSSTEAVSLAQRFGTSWHESPGTRPES